MSATTASEQSGDQPHDQQHDDDHDEDVGDTHGQLPCPALCRRSSSLLSRSSAYSSVRMLSALGDRAASARAISSSPYASDICTSMTSSRSTVLGIVAPVFCAGAESQRGDAALGDRVEVLLDAGWQQAGVAPQATSLLARREGDDQFSTCHVAHQPFAGVSRRRRAGRLLSRTRPGQSRPRSTPIGSAWLLRGTSARGSAPGSLPNHARTGRRPIGGPWSNAKSPTGREDGGALG
jgi:hypothetical protein